jgi:polar amino acid transport system substrate-binding protein
VINDKEQLVRELAATGRLRTTINLGNIVLAQRNKDGSLGGVSADLARELASRLGVEAELHPFDTAGAAFEALKSGACDVGFLAIDPKRAEDLDYTAPYVIIEGTYLVPEASSFHTVEQVDRDGVKIAAGKNSAYDLHLMRALRHAKLVHYPSSQAAVDGFLADETDVVAGVRQPLVTTAAKRSGVRVLDGKFLTIEQAMTLPKGHPAGHAYLRRFIEEMKASGFVAEALARSGQGEAQVAPAALL